MSHVERSVELFGLKFKEDALEVACVKVRFVEHVPVH